MKEIALITGATSGIGAAFAKEYARQGYNLIITGRRKNQIMKFAEDIRKIYKINVDVFLVELNDEKEFKSFLHQIEKYKNIEILVNNAGFGYNEFLGNGRPEIFKEMVNVHITVPVRIINTILPSMIKKNKGTIINVSSDGVYLLIPKNTVYSGTKAFLKTFSEGLKIELLETNIKVQALCPGLTKTELHKKMGMSLEMQNSYNWMTPDYVVKESLKCLSSNKVVCIPSRKTKMQILFLNLLPRISYYRVMYNIWKNKINIQR